MKIILCNRQIRNVLASPKSDKALFSDYRHGYVNLFNSKLHSIEVVLQHSEIIIDIWVAHGLQCEGG